ncbi:hypothetical protein BASA50_007977 [Batrachochytrium salamandrivorans]|uniref:Eukaryotic translation initiation factor 3 subunit H n=1 Tax=Batrachochytrium salamandrivorans TaxID=1357716 RepID=A0ABQ8F6N2_9FUNG|nr:hypothetical protein BASA62_007117 [Batrachochytrium salamandrivorans]KAH6572021.1 hypothetical protein BASA60_006791 [Batrachochytrium salamandrivorans]KAH6590826.1 hypothetical protein BASA61_005113 [Batrachochytrium salamandrivorans]KAH6592601.1 hypothetical protein BASA50_007977 [Batrachochytrium salamandrivorans]KAH9273348.1 hypothetical protein BASA83_004349 [Batrachochytrium salamandrivorans]
MSKSSTSGAAVPSVAAVAAAAAASAAAEAAAAVAASLELANSPVGLDAAPELPLVDWSTAEKKALLVSKKISQVELSALVVLKMIKHCKDGYPATCSGQLLGVDVTGKMQITNAFPFTAEAAVGGGAASLNAPTAAPAAMAVIDDALSTTVDGPAVNTTVSLTNDASDYQAQMMRCLRSLNYDANTVGWYQSAYMGSYWNQAFIEAQYNYQKALPHAVVVTYDHAKTSQGNLTLKALRLSDTFMAVYESRKFTMENILKHKLTPGTVFEVVPVKIQSSYLLNAALLELSNQPKLPDSSSLSSSFPLSLFSTDLSSDSTSLVPNFDNLELSSETYLEKHLEHLVESVEEHGQEQWRWQGWQRSFNKEQIKSQHHISQMNVENAAAIAAGNPPPYSEDELKTPLPSFSKVVSNEPSRLETLIISNQIDTYCKQINQFAGPALTKMFVAKSLQPEA